MTHDSNLCELCGEPMPDGEKMFKYHGFSGPCPKPPKTKNVLIATMSLSDQSSSKTAQVVDKPAGDEELNSILLDLVEYCANPRQEWMPVIDEARDKILSLLVQASAQAEMRGRVEELEYLLDAQDQEVDLDGRPITEPYHIISGDGERYLIEARLAQLRAQGGDSKS